MQNDNGFFTKNTCWWLAVVLLSVPQTVISGGLDSLNSFFNGLETLQADFEQRVLDDQRTVIQESTGKVWIQRPGLFRWNYQTPYVQQIVADGSRLWVYDEDLEQVTVKPMKDVLSATPAMLLSGEQPLEEVFLIKELPTQNEFAYVLLTPRDTESTVEKIKIAFSGGTLGGMEVIDNFGNRSYFSFSNLSRNPGIKADRFRFQPPPGADVIGETD